MAGRALPLGQKIWLQQTMACDLEQVIYSLSLSFFLCEMGTMPANNRIVVWSKHDSNS